MKRRLISVIVFALLTAALSSTLLYKIISAKSQRGGKSAMERVLVAAHDLNAGVQIAEADVIEVDWPVVAGSQWIHSRSDVVGRGLVAPIGKDEPFTGSRLAAKGAGAGLASQIPSGMRAVAVHVDELTGLSRFLVAGMRVDVISTGAAAGQNGQGMVTRTILQNIEVVSTGGSPAHDTKEKQADRAFNLLVTPQQAEVLSQAVAQSKIELVLRNPLDKGSFLSASSSGNAAGGDTLVPRVMKSISKRPALAPTPPPPPVLAKAAAPQASFPTVEVIHGIKKTVSAVATVTTTEPLQ